MRRAAQRGFTLMEMLVTFTLLGIIAAVVVPIFSSDNSRNLDVATEETVNVLRLAMSEARRTGGYVLVDGQTTEGHLFLYQTNSNADLPPASGVVAIADPLTKRAVDLNPTKGAFSAGVVLTPQFIAGGSSKKKLLIGPGLSGLQVFTGGSNKGPLEANSGVLLTLGSESRLVAIDAITGLVSLP